MAQGRKTRQSIKSTATKVFSMNILAFVDTHGSKKAFEEIVKRAQKADMLVCAGDLTSWGEHTDVALKIIEKAKKPMIIIPGNHEDSRELSHICGKYSFCIYLHRAAYEFGEYMFFGFGGGGFSETNAEFERVSKRVMNDAKGKKIILITHGPPYGTNLDALSGGWHHGCKSIRRFIEDAKPMIAISGHLHETGGSTDMIGKTFLINPGPLGAMLKV